MEIQVYKRAEGRCGVRNHVVVMPGVLCADTAARRIVRLTEGLTYIYNPNGCGQNPKDAAVSLSVMAGMIANPNVFGALIVGLGCEMADEAAYMTAVRRLTGKPVYYIGIQKEGGIGKTVEKGRQIAGQLLLEAGRCRREPADISELFLGLECGGSDPSSGISANTVLGRVTDRLIEAGGSAVLSETAEAIGAEHILQRRGRTPEIGQKICDCITEWEQARFTESGIDIRRTNPSQGNIASGLTTLSEKSLGCIHKSGSHPFDGCYEYGDFIREKGLFFLNATAYDPVNTAALAACGSQIAAFTTGMGNPIGNPIVPVVKITGNSYTAGWLEDIIDFDSSPTIEGLKTVDEAAEELLALIKEVAEGKLTKAEINGACEMGINQNFSYV